MGTNMAINGKRSSDGKTYGWDASGEEVARLKAQTPAGNDARNASRGLQRGLLAVLTSGTSEIKTGSGEYGDETVADSIFPKTVNNLMSGDREDARAGKDAASKALVDKAASQAALAPDGADKALKTSRRQGQLRLLSGRGRKSSFLTEGY